MQKTHWLFGGLLLTFLFFSCSTTKVNTKTENQVQKKDSVIPSEVIKQPGKDIFRISISFNSQGAGIDREAKSNFDSFLKNFESKNNVKLDYNFRRTGKEGEVMYCFKLSELDAEKQDSFINESKTLLKSSALVTINENSQCQ